MKKQLYLVRRIQYCCSPCPVQPLHYEITSLDWAVARLGSIFGTFFCSLHWTSPILCLCIKHWWYAWSKNVILSEHCFDEPVLDGLSLSIWLWPELAVLCSLQCTNKRIHSFSEIYLSNIQIFKMIMLLAN